MDRLIGLADAARCCRVAEVMLAKAQSKLICVDRLDLADQLLDGCVEIAKTRLKVSQLAGQASQLAALEERQERLFQGQLPF